jgi:hydroxylysine kinase
MAAMQGFMATMVAHAPPVSAGRAAALARERYGLEACAERLSGERDENFRLTTADGGRHVLKVAHEAEDAAVSLLPVAALLHVEKSDPLLPCPRIIPAGSGATHVRFMDESGSHRLAYLITCLPGRPLAATSRSAAQRIACGRIAARLSAALRNFMHPAARRTLIRDLRHVPRIGALLAEVGSFPARERALELLAVIAPAASSRLPQLRHQAVHNDLNPFNILVDPADPARVTGIINFGDVSRTALVADVAVTAAEQLPEECVGDAARRPILEVVAAYHERVPLLAEELAILNTLVAARLVTNLVMQAWHVHHNPGSARYAPPGNAFVRARLEIAAGLLREELRL